MRDDQAQGPPPQLCARRRPHHRLPTRAADRGQPTQRALRRSRATRAPPDRASRARTARTRTAIACRLLAVAGLREGCKSCTAASLPTRPAVGPSRNRNRHARSQRRRPRAGQCAPPRAAASAPTQRRGAPAHSIDCGRPAQVATSKRAAVAAASDMASATWSHRRSSSGITPLAVESSWAGIHLTRGSQIAVRRHMSPLGTSRAPWPRHLPVPRPSRLHRCTCSQSFARGTAPAGARHRRTLRPIDARRGDKNRAYPAARRPTWRGPATDRHRRTRRRRCKPPLRATPAAGAGRNSGAAASRAESAGRAPVAAGPCPLRIPPRAIPHAVLQRHDAAPAVRAQLDSSQAGRHSPSITVRSAAPWSAGRDHAISRRMAARSGAHRPASPRQRPLLRPPPTGH